MSVLGNNLGNNSSMNISSKNITSDRLSPTLSFGEIEELLAYQIYYFDLKKYPTTYQAVNVCINIIQSNNSNDCNIHQESSIKIKNKQMICNNYMVYVFKSLLHKTVMRHYKRIMLYLNKSLRGSFVDFSDVYQDLYVYFVELISKYDINSGVYFVTYLRRYLFYWGKNSFPVRKKDLKIEVNSLQDIMSNSDTSKHNSDRDVIGNSYKSMSVIKDSNRMDVDVHLFEDAVIDNIVIWDFRKKLIQYLNQNVGKLDDSDFIVNRYLSLDKQVEDKTVSSSLDVVVNKDKSKLNNKNKLNNKKRRKKTSASEILLIYDFFYINNERNYSKISLELGCNPQKIHYYILLINKLFQEYLSK